MKVFLSQKRVIFGTAIMLLALLACPGIARAGDIFVDQANPKADDKNPGTLAAPLKDALHTPDVIIVVANPEQSMWLCMAASYYSGRRFDFRVSGYNALCVEATVIPHTTGRINVSFGCYGCRGSTDIGDDLMFVGIPLSEMPAVIRGLEELARKAIPDSRGKIYLPI